MNTLAIPENATPSRNRVTCNFDQIREPGTYVENRWGTLFRMPEDGLPANRPVAAKRASLEIRGSRSSSRERSPAISGSRRVSRGAGKTLNSRHPYHLYREVRDWDEKA